MKKKISYPKLLAVALIVFGLSACANRSIKKSKKLSDLGTASLNQGGQSVPLDKTKVAEAIDYFNRSLEINPKNAVARLSAGYSYYVLQNYSLAIRTYDKFVEDYPQLSAGYHYRAISKQDSGLYQAALKDFLTAKDLDRKNHEIYYNLGKLHYKMDDYQTALEYYDKATEYKEDYVKSYFAMGALYREMGDYYSALKHLGKTIDLDSTSARAFEERGLIYLNQKKYDLAKKDLNTALRISQTSYQAYFYRGLLNKALHNTDSMQADFLKAGELRSAEYNKFYNIGKLLANNGDYAEAVVYYDKALAEEKNTNTYDSRGYCNLMLKNYGEALKDYHATLQLDSTSLNSRNSRGMAYYYLGKHDSAIVDFNTCIRMNPNYLYPLNNIANCYLKMGQTDKACEYWKSALSKGYVYNPAWKKEFDIDDPKELVKQHCN